jgi:glycerophosphoryl diester phosphodiesterase
VTGGAGGGPWAVRGAGAGPRVIGHRGAAGAAVENTLEAFDEAARQGADGVEFDVRPCRGGELVVLHDADLGRVTGGADRRAVAALDARELGRVRLAGGERVPRLEEAVA